MLYCSELSHRVMRTELSECDFYNAGCQVTVKLAIAQTENVYLLETFP